MLAGRPADGVVSIAAEPDQASINNSRCILYDSKISYGEDAKVLIDKVNRKL